MRKMEEMQVGDVVHFRCKNHPLSGKGVVFMGKEVDGLGEKIRSASEIPEPEEIMDGYTLITMMRYIELTEERVSSHGKADGFEPKDVQGN